jgi:microtubule-associated protein-like 6
MHEEDIVCLDVWKSKYAATGSQARGNKSKLVEVYVWELGSDNMRVLSCLKGFHLRNVTTVRFSPSGKKLLTIGGDNDHSVAIYDWARGRLLSTSKVDKARVTDAVWKNEIEFVTCGLNHIKFWRQHGQNISSKSGVLGKGKWKPLGAICYAFEN